MLDRLYSPQEVLNTFPEGHRPSLRRLIAKAKEAGVEKRGNSVQTIKWLRQKHL